MSTITSLTRPAQASSTTHTFPSEGGRRLGDHQSDHQAEEECPVCPPLPRPNEEITSIPIEESQALPEPRNDPQPEYWNDQLRGNPRYQATLRNQDFSIRPLGQNRGEYTFLCFMLTGVMIQNYANMAWRATGGRVTDRIFRFKIGGTW